MADLRVSLLGLHLRNPILPGAGPNVDSGADLAAAAAGGAGGLLCRTITLQQATAHHPAVVQLSREALLHREHGSVRPVGEWLASELPAAAAAARAHGLPLVAALSGTESEVGVLGPQLVAAGAKALELSLHATERGRIVTVVRALRAAVAVPIIAKLSPHHGEDLAELAAELEPLVDAFTCIGSFGPVLGLDVEQGTAALAAPLGIGYLSGPAIRPIAQRFVFEVARRVAKPVIACGGVTSGREAVAMLLVGASAVQVCSQALLRGPAVYGRIARELDEWMDAHGYPSVSALSGAYIRKYGPGQRVVVAKEEAPQLDADRCIKCGICEQVCYYDAIQAPPRVLPAIAFDPCFECGLCVSACPPGALSFRPRDEQTRLSIP